MSGTVGNLRSGWIQPDGSFQADRVAIGENAIRLVYAGIQIPGGESLFGGLAHPDPQGDSGPAGGPLTSMSWKRPSAPVRRPRPSEIAPRARRSRRRAMSPPVQLAEPPASRPPPRRSASSTATGRATSTSTGTIERTRGRPSTIRGERSGSISRTRTANSTDETEALLRNVFGFHPLAIEDAIQDSHIPKVDDWGDYLYLVFHGTSIDPQTDELRLHELDIFLGPNYLVTYHTEPLSFLDQDRQAHRARPRRPAAARVRPPALPRSSSVPVDQSLEAIEHLDDRHRRRSRTEVIDDPAPETLQTIFRVKRSAIRLHKIFGPQREVLNRLARDPYKPIQAEHRVYFRDVYDHVVRIHDISESLRDLIAGTLDTYLSVDVEPHQRHHEDPDARHGHVHADVVPRRLLRHELLRRDPGVPDARSPRRCSSSGRSPIMCVSPTLMWTYVRRRKWF